MSVILYAFPIVFLLYSLLYFYISIRAIVLHKPTVIHSRLRIILLIIAFVPCIIWSIMVVDFTEPIFLINTLYPAILILIIVYYFFVIKGYNIFCTNDVDFRNSIVYALDKNGIHYSEKMNSIGLIDLNNEINITYVSRTGTGTIKIKNKKDYSLFRQIIKDIILYYKENKINTKNIMVLFFILFGIMYLGLGIAFVFLMNNIL